MNHNIGVCTWTFGGLPLADIAQRLSSLGFDGVELMGDLNAYSAAGAVAEAKTILDDHGLRTLSLTPDNVDLAHPDNQTRTQAIDYYFRLLDFAAELDRPLVSCHGYVGRVRAISTQAEERKLFERAVRQVAARADELGLRLVMEVLNRYEAHLCCTGAETADFIDAYHMNIEEPDPAAALRQAGDKLWLYHIADSNRQGIGRGHTDFTAQLSALTDIGYDGPIILECTAPGPDPFSAIKDEGSLAWLEAYLGESLRWLRL